MVNLTCRGEPNPHLHGIPHTPPRPFHTSADNAIIITVVHIASVLDVSTTFTLVMHRRALLDTITNLTSPDKLLPLNLRPHFNNTLVSKPDHDMPYSLSSAVSTSFQEPHNLGGRYGWYPIPWSEWGPSISRWFVNQQSPTEWITISAGQRLAVLDPADDGRHRISIIDFNPYNIHNVPSDLPGKVIVERRGAFLSHGGAFTEDIEMGLSCIIYTAPETYDFDGLLMEEERLVGLKVCMHAMALHLSILTVGRPAPLGMFKSSLSSILAEFCVLHVCARYCCTTTLYSSQ